MSLITHIYYTCVYTNNKKSSWFIGTTKRCYISYLLIFQDILTCTRELNATKEELAQRNEEVVELKAERNNTRASFILRNKI